MTTSQHPARFACLTYHDIGDAEEQYTVSTAALHSQLCWLRSEGFTGESFEHFGRRVASGENLPTRYVLLTGDDGRGSTKLLAETLAKHGFFATFFVVRDFCRSKSGYLRENDIRELRRAGFSFGSHGLTHRKLTRLPAYECRRELRESRYWLEQVLGEPVSDMAAPGGFINRAILRIAGEYGYSLVGTCNEWMNVASHELPAPCAINRVNIRRHFTTAVLRDIVQGRPGFYLHRQLRAAALWLPKRVIA